jgi:hypothetical protein
MSLLKKIFMLLIKQNLETAVTKYTFILLNIAYVLLISEDECCIVAPPPPEKKSWQL